MTLLLLGHSFRYEMENVIRLFDPGAELQILSEGNPDQPETAATILQEGGGEILLTATLRTGAFHGKEFAFLAEDSSEDEREFALARLLYRLLRQQTGKRPPWGILTGVRPVRLCRAWAQSGLDEGQIRGRLADNFYVSDEKAELALRTLAVEQGLLRRLEPKGISLYVSVPFCPSRCLYCSFVSHDLKGAAKLMPDYLRCLREELAETGRLVRELGLHVQTIYVGGGTPTSLDASQLRQLLEAVGEGFDLSHLLEYTVEAGRPDTITGEKLQVLRELRVDRVSINPQTMNDQTLRRIGRNHTAAETVEAFSLARQAGFSCINMDLIAGLPGDSPASFRDTLERVLELSPENVTVHTLTVKRSSRLRDEENVFRGNPDAAGMVTHSAERLRGAGYLPYYLYRQKGTVESLENTGYSLPGSEGLYNVLIMEEVQTILAVGAGAVTKLCRPDERIQRVYNYKYPQEYVRGFGEILRRKEAIRLFYETY